MVKHEFIVFPIDEIIFSVTCRLTISIENNLPTFKENVQMFV